jgi:hypothetical protein
MIDPARRDPSRTNPPRLLQKNYTPLKYELHVADLTPSAFHQVADHIRFNMTLILLNSNNAT